jgi:8-hydroxy-5-deazaflavin:NADPH oxidoreductase
VKIGILGATGPAGTGLVARLAAAGHHVLAGSRDEARAEEVVRTLVDRWGSPMAGIEGASNADVAAGAEIVVLATNASATVATAAEHAARLAGKPVVSIANPLRKVGKAFVPIRVEEGSLAQAVQRAAPEARVAAALHHIPARALRDLDKPCLAGDVAVVSDDAEALAATQALVSAIPALRAVDGGPLENAVALEAFSAVLLTVNIRHGGTATLRLMPA